MRRNLKEHRMCYAILFDGVDFFSPDQAFYELFCSFRAVTGDELLNFRQSLQGFRRPHDFHDAILLRRRFSSSCCNRGVSKTLSDEASLIPLFMESMNNLECRNSSKSLGDNSTPAGLPFCVMMTGWPLCFTLLIHLDNSALNSPKGTMSFKTEISFIATPVFGTKFGTKYSTKKHP